jgi:hypothetical protein
MRRMLLALMFFAAAAWAVNVKLYLKDGSYQIVREYKVESDRVRYYTVERSEWEEIPLDMVDLKRTETEAAARQAELDKDAKALAEEDAAERATVKEAMRIPETPGVYWIDGNETKAIKAAESAVHTNKRREVLKALSPIPTVTGKATLEIGGAHSPNVFTNSEQEFYIELSDPERFGVVKLTPKGAVRIVENLTIQPITREVDEEPELVDTFQQQLDNNGNGLYKIWPKEKLPPGEYAVIEYTPGKLVAQIWDFAIKAAK